MSLYKLSRAATRSKSSDRFSGGSGPQAVMICCSWAPLASV